MKLSLQSHPTLYPLPLIYVAPRVTTAANDTNPPRRACRICGVRTDRLRCPSCLCATTSLRGQS